MLFSCVWLFKTRLMVSAHSQETNTIGWINQVVLQALTPIFHSAFSQPLFQLGLRTPMARKLNKRLLLSNVFSKEKMPALLATRKLVWALYWLLVIFPLVIAIATESNDTIKRSFHADSDPSFETVTFPFNDDERFNFTDGESTTETVITTTHRPINRDSPLSVVNRCLDRYLSFRFLGPLFMFAAFVGLFNGPLVAVKLLMFSLQFNITFPTFVCSVTVRQIDTIKVQSLLYLYYCDSTGMVEPESCFRTTHRRRWSLTIYNFTSTCVYLLNVVYKYELFTGFP